MAVYIKSNQVKVYPSALRGGTDNLNNTIQFDPEARLSTENNTNSRINAITTGRPFIISADLKKGNYSVCLDGYVFYLSNISDVLNSAVSGTPVKGDKMYLNILSSELASAYSGKAFTKDYTVKTLLNIKENISGTTFNKDNPSAAVLDATEGGTVSNIESDYNFYGLAVTYNAPMEGCTSSLILLKYKNGKWEINEGGFGKITTKDVIVTVNEYGDNITLDTIINESGAASADKLSHTRKLWGQDFDGTGDVSGKMTNVTSISWTENEAIAGDIGIEDEPFNNIYVNSVHAKNIEFLDGEGKPVDVGAKNRLIYIKDGVFKEGIAIYSGTGNPNDDNNKPDGAQTGDIYIELPN